MARSPRRSASTGSSRRTSGGPIEAPGQTEPRVERESHGDAMRLTERRLNRATLCRQLLLGRERIPVVDAVRRIVAIQAQEPPSPFIALWNRVDRFDPADLHRALATQDIVKATLMRITLHAVAADDYPAIHEAMQRTLRGARLNDRRRSEERRVGKE